MNKNMKKNYVGVSFAVARTYTNHLGRLFENIQIEAYTWYALQSENYISETKGMDFFLQMAYVDERLDQYLEVLENN